MDDYTFYIPDDETLEGITTVKGEKGTSGTPLVATSTSAMTDKERIYINTTDGHWYYWNGAMWEDGGVYQVAEDTVLHTLEKLDEYFEMGNITIGASPQRPTYSDSTTRYRTKMNSYLFLREGDIVSFKESGWRVYVGWFDMSGAWHYHLGWVDNKYTVTQTGNYCLLIRKSTESTISSLSAALSQLSIKHSYVMNTEAILPQNEHKRINHIIKSIAHRGYRRFYPENTLPAFNAAARYGFNAIETDVKWTSDGVAVLLHDNTINRTARNADGTNIASTVNIADITYEQALQYDFGIFMGEQFAGTKIPTLEQAIAACKLASIDMYLDFGGSTLDNVHACMDLVAKYGMMEHTSWITSGPTVAGWFSSYIDTARVGIICTDISQTIIDRAVAQQTGKNEVFIDYLYTSTSMTDALRDSMIANDIKLECYTPIYIGAFINGIDPYITGVTSEWFTSSDIRDYALYKGNYYIY